jgi:hypothetical protein
MAKATLFPGSYKKPTPVVKVSLTELEEDLYIADEKALEHFLQENKWDGNEPIDSDITPAVLADLRGLALDLEDEDIVFFPRR